ncbi:ExbD/TolR family protein [Candidatus Latescibacterota bacterium]
MKTRQKRESIMAEGEIDLTPLIDCIFLLLIFFMVTTVFIDVKGLVVDLPGASDSSEEQQQQKKDVNIGISASGEYTVAGEPVTATSLPMAINGKMAEFNNKTVIIQGDQLTEHRFIIYAMDVAQGEGAEQMAFAIEEEQEEQ